MATPVLIVYVTFDLPSIVSSSAKSQRFSSRIHNADSSKSENENYGFSGKSNGKTKDA